jgi:hypothetical protein
VSLLACSDFHCQLFGHYYHFGRHRYSHHTVVKQLPKSIKNPRDHYTEGELIVLTASEYAARQRGINNNSQGIDQLMDDAQVAGKFGGQVRQFLEQATGEPVVSTTNFLDQSKSKQRRKRVSHPVQPLLLENNGEL